MFFRLNYFLFCMCVVCLYCTRKCIDRKEPSFTARSSKHFMSRSFLSFHRAKGGRKQLFPSPSFFCPTHQSRQKMLWGGRRGGHKTKTCFTFPLWKKILGGKKSLLRSLVQVAGTRSAEILLFLYFFSPGVKKYVANYIRQQRRERQKQKPFYSPPPPSRRTCNQGN